MANNEVIDAETGELITEPGAAMFGAIAQINASEIDRQIATARAFPRKRAEVRREILELVTQDQDIASSMM